MSHNPNNTKVDELGEKLLDYIIEYICGQQEYYQDEFPYVWSECMRQVDFAKFLFEEEKFKQLVTDYMKEVVNDN